MEKVLQRSSEYWLNLLPRDQFEAVYIPGPGFKWSMCKVL